MTFTLFTLCYTFCFLLYFNKLFSPKKRFLINNLLIYCTNSELVELDVKFLQRNLVIKNVFLHSELIINEIFSHV